MYYYWEVINPYMFIIAIHGQNSWLLIIDSIHRFCALIKTQSQSFILLSMRLLMDQPNYSHCGAGIHIGWSIQSENFVMSVVNIILKHYI
jgi:hypothetical protein